MVLLLVMFVLVFTLMVSRVGSAGVCVADVVVCVVGDVDTDDCGVVVVGVDGCVCGGVGMWCDSVGVFDIVDGDAIVIARGCVACVCCVLDRIVVVGSFVDVIDGVGGGIIRVGVGCVSVGDGVDGVVAGDVCAGIYVDGIACW